MDKDSSIDGLLKESADFMFSSEEDEQEEDEQEEEGGKAKLPLLVRGKPKRGDGDSSSSSSSEEEVTGTTTAPSTTAPSSGAQTPAAVGANKHSGSRKRRPTTTSRAKNSKQPVNKRLRIKKRCRIKITKALLYHAVKEEEQRKAIEPYGNNRNCYGRIISGSTRADWVIAFDDFPAEHKNAKLSRAKIILVAPCDEEKEYDHGKCNEIEGYIRIFRGLGTELQ
jgi:hypothetical protein